MAKKAKTNSYFKLGLILLGVAIFTLLAANIYKNILDNKINNSYLGKFVSSIGYNEIANAKLEFSGDTFLYISYTGEKKIYDLEVKLKKLIKENNLNDQTILLDMTTQTKNSNYIAKLNDVLELNEIKISDIPAIIYYRDDKVTAIIDSKNQMLSSGDFLQLLEQYEIVKSYR